MLTEMNDFRYWWNSASRLYVLLSDSTTFHFWFTEQLIAELDAVSL